MLAQPTGNIANRDYVYQLIENHWRATFKSNCTSNEQIDGLENQLRAQLLAYGETLPTNEHSRVIEFASSISKQFSDECEADARALRRRLCGPEFDAPAASSSSSRLGNVIVDTAVRATVWQLIAALFRR